MTFLSDRINTIQPSATLAMTSKAKMLKESGLDIISLSAGEPDFDTPEHIKAAAINAIQQGQTKYTHGDGTLALRKAVATKFLRENQLSYTADQILVSCGAKHSLFNLFQAVLNKGDEVVIPAPYWVSYPDMAKLCEATPIEVPATLETHLKITPDQLAKAMSNKTKLVVFNAPNNPSGMIYSHAEWKALADVLLNYPHALIVTDDIYEHISWTTEPFSNILNVCPALYDRTIVVNGVSKAYSMTGWRIGYAAGPKMIISAMSKMQSQSTSNACSISQAAALEALNGDQSCIEPMRQAFKSRHDYVVNRLNLIPGFTCLSAQGAFYAFPHIESAMKAIGIKDDVAFAEYILEKALVAGVPGSAFGMPGYIRFSYATDMKSLETALDRIEQLFKGK